MYYVPYYLLKQGLTIISAWLAGTDQALKSQKKKKTNLHI